VFEYCSSRHTNPNYLYSGTTDCGILDLKTRVLLLYSVVNMGGQWKQLHVVAPVHFEDFVKANVFKGENLKEIFRVAEKEKGMKVKVKCVRAESDELLKLIRHDAADLTPADLAALETIIAEVF